MTKTETIKEWLSGRKTYLVVAAGLLAVLLGWVDGNITDVQAMEQGIALILAATYRSALTSLSRENAKLTAEALKETTVEIATATAVEVIETKAVDANGKRLRIFK